MTKNKLANAKSYLADYESFAKTVSAAPAWMRDIRLGARDHFARQGFPEGRDETWRFTRVRPLLRHDFRLQYDGEPNGISAERVAAMNVAGNTCHTLVFINGRYAPALSSSGGSDGGFSIGNLKSAIESDPGHVRPELARLADSESNPFVALNTAHLIDGAFVRVSREAVVDKPIHLMFVSTTHDGPTVSYPRNLIVAGDNSRVTLIESYVGEDQHVYFTNAVTEINVGEGANVQHYKVQDESTAAFHFATLQARLGRGSRFQSGSFSIGGALVRNDITTHLGGEDADCTLDGLYIARNGQHVDNHTLIEHAEPECNSYELYKGILSDRARAVFNGRIHVHPDAQKTDAKQSNGCLLLSKDAQVNTNPQLEIYADDVRCTHGAAVGQVDEDAVFYLRSRGIEARSARHMLVYAFANEVLERVQAAGLRRHLGARVSTWLAQVENDSNMTESRRR